eukprot:NODE_4491_length_1159_cov_97.030888_g3973_i0.p1 GENE.NODE_4491_length_1159_cov_97.030888_g3973_i0~~NODE_4491_length_1159_cov_97.030888_g3973_i0.p1  ORF type:complete len:347 (+),score=75.65 NODE_4491_length_1159_cov_97.030888_g3973_i0:30-1070(+)
MKSCVALFLLLLCVLESHAKSKKLYFVTKDGLKVPFESLESDVPKNAQPRGDAKATLPPAVDLRQYFPQVYQQGGTSSCTANAIAGAFGYLNSRQGEQKLGLITLQKIFIYYNARAAKTDKITDNGSNIGLSIDTLQEVGACSESTWPFDPKQVNKQPPSEAYDEAEYYKITEVKSIPVDEKQIKSTLAEGFPIVFGLYLTEQFMRPGKTGYIAEVSDKNPIKNKPKTTKHSAHAMLLVGYSDKKQHYIIRNSWGTTWGDNGYGYVPYNYVHNKKYNVFGMYSIHALSEYDFTPVEDMDEDEDWPDQGEADYEVEEDEVDEVEEEVEDEEGESEAESEAETESGDE